MDSKLINKLIRSQVWPLLREHGFTHFDSRNAFGYQGPFVNVVNFQSFNSYLAEGLGCTTYSFTVRLGTYVIGSPGEDHVAHDKEGRPRPMEYECSFRTELRKRTVVDGFARSDIFYIHPDGRTLHACFHEVQHLLRDVAAKWFREHNDIDDLIARMTAEQSASSQSIDASGPPRSYSWYRLESVLSLLKHKQEPTQGSADLALSSIDGVIGAILNFSTIQVDRLREERYALDVRVLWDQLGRFRPIPVCFEASISAKSSLDNSNWMPTKKSLVNAADEHPLPVSTSARRQLWPVLKNSRFSEFTDRLAHRSSGDLVEVVEFLPVDRFECKALNLPPGLFRIGVGVYWTAIGEDGLVRRNGKKEPRPTVNECHVSNWLTPQVVKGNVFGTIFCSVEDASAALAADALEWLNIFKNHEMALSLLERRDRELFVCYPMMRGYGASSSSRRLIYIALLKHLLGNNVETQEYVHRAEMAIPISYPEHLRSRYETWIEEVKVGLREVGRQSKI